MIVDIRTGHVLEVLASMDCSIAQTCVTSPPYWGLRDYGTEPPEWPEVTFSPMPGLPPMTIPAQSVNLGAEADPWAYVGHMVLVFRAVARVLRGDGALWLNLGDSYGQSASSSRQNRPGHETGSPLNPRGRNFPPPGGLKPKDLVGIPWRVAFALQADGWYLRSDIIWAKPNPMPEPVQDRPTKAHEYLFLMTRAKRYFYDADAVREIGITDDRARTSWGDRKASEPSRRGDPGLSGHTTTTATLASAGGRNRRSVWTIATQPFPGAHFAVFPPALPEVCIKAGSAVGDTVLDPFNGAGTTGLVSARLGRNYIGAELSEEYAQMARERIAQDSPPSTEELERKGLAGQIGMFGSAP